jgi:hypothetical protein
MCAIALLTAAWQKRCGTWIYFGPTMKNTKPARKRSPQKSATSTDDALSDLLLCIARVFEQVKSPWFVFGAQALATYGVPRATADVDVTVRLHGTTAQLCTALRAHGFSIAIAAKQLSRFVEETRVIPAIHDATKIPVDIVLAGPGLEEQIMARAVPFVVKRTSIPVIAMEDFVVLKILASRSKDDNDILLLLAQRFDEINTTSVGHQIAELESILDQSDLSAKWNSLLRQAMLAKRRRR